MSKAEMPEPFEYTSTYNTVEGLGLIGLITIEQAEAYKDACVREALEDALLQVDSLINHSCSSRRSWAGGVSDALDVLLEIINKKNISD